MNKLFATLFSLITILIYSVPTHSQTTVILFGGEGTELSAEGVLTGDGPSGTEGLGAAILDTFNFQYRPGGFGQWEDNLFPDPEVYSLQMNIPDGLPNYQSRGRHEGFWDSRGRIGVGILPWIDEDWRDGEFYESRYRPTGEESPYGLVSSDVQWTINYWDGEGDDAFVHTIFTGTVAEFVYNEASGDAFAYLNVLNSAYLGYGENNEPGPGVVDYHGGGYQGFDSFREPSGMTDFKAFIFEYNGHSQTGRLSPVKGRTIVFTPTGEVFASYNDIQRAIERAGYGYSVLVMPGLYNENIDFLGRNVRVTSLYDISGDEMHIDSTIIDGGEFASVVTFENGEDENVVFSGFTIRNGAASEGAGIYCNGTSPTIRNCVIVGNTAGNHGGGVFINNGDPSLFHCFISNNTASIGAGGGIAAQQSSFTIDHCIISHNTGRWGGGISARNTGDPVIRFTEITNNIASHSAGLYFLSQGEVTLRNCTIAYNDATNHSGGVHIADGTRIDAVNTIFWENDPDQGRFSNIGDRGILNIDYSCIQDGENGFNLNNNGAVDWGDNNITEDPGFTDLREDDYHLQEDSPCIDTGDPALSLDPDGSRSDMGAYFLKRGSFITVPDDYPTIQFAIDAADEGDTIIVSPGRYHENINFHGRNVLVASLFLLAEEPDDSLGIADTYIDGNSTGSVVTFERGETNEAVLYGFIIINGSTDSNGGGIRCSNASPTISNCIIVDNYAANRGGGIACDQEANPSFIECLIIGNSSNSNDSTSSGGGGGVAVEGGSNPYFYECRILENQTALNGSSFSVSEGSTPAIVNCTIFRNMTILDELSANMVFVSGSDPIFINTIFWNNIDREIRFDPDNDASSVVIVTSDVQGGEGIIETENNGEIHWLDGNIDQYPSFINRDENDFRLAEDSPCIDVGTAFFVWEGDTILNLVRWDYFDAAPDMGAYESNYNWIEDFTDNFPDAFRLYPAYPNPFNASTSILFDQPSASNIQLTVYDLAGRKVAQLVDGRMNAGSHRIGWQAENLSSGLYIVQLRGLDQVRTQKVMLIR